MLTDPASAFFINRQVSSFVSHMELATRRVKNARSVMDVVRAANGRPVAPAYIAALPDIRLAKERFEQSISRASDLAVEQQFAQLDALLKAGDRVRLQNALGTFQRDLRYLSPLAPRLMRLASQEIWKRFRFIESASAIDGHLIRSLLPVDDRTQLSMEEARPGEIIVLCEVIYEDSTVIAVSNSQAGDRRAIVFDPDGSAYNFIDSRSPEPRLTGSLHQCISQFEEEVGVTLPDIKVISPRVGVWEAHNPDDPRNPWKLAPGCNFEVTSRARGTRRYSVLESGLVVRTDAADANEPFDPRTTWSVDDWRNLQQLPDPGQEIIDQRPRG